MKTQQEKDEVKAAFAAGREIETKLHSPDLNPWMQCPAPIWNWGRVDYRIAPGQEAPAPCGFQVGNDYPTRGQGYRRMVVGYDPGHPRPVLASIFCDGKTWDEVRRYHEDGKVDKHLEFDEDLILPAAKKKVPLTAADVPDDAVFRRVGGSDPLIRVKWFRLTERDIMFAPGLVLPWDKLMDIWQYRSATTTGGEWRGCWKETEVEA